MGTRNLSISSERDESFYNQDFILLSLTVYIIPHHLKFLNNTARYSLHRNIFISVNFNNLQEHPQTAHFVLWVLLFLSLTITGKVIYNMFYESFMIYILCLGIGYNGFPRGCSDDKLPWAKVSIL